MHHNFEENEKSMLMIAFIRCEPSKNESNKQFFMNVNCGYNINLKVVFYNKKYGAFMRFFSIIIRNHYMYVGN